MASDESREPGGEDEGGDGGGPDMSILEGEGGGRDATLAAAGIPPEALAAAMGRFPSGSGAAETNDTEADADKDRGKRPRADSRAQITSITADLGPSAGAAFRSWAARHRDLLVGVDEATQFSWYLHACIWAHYAAERGRPEPKREYDDAALFLEDLDGLISRQVDAGKVAAVAEAVAVATAQQRQAIAERLKAIEAPAECVEAALIGGGGPNG